VAEYDDLCNERSDANPESVIPGAMRGLSSGAHSHDPLDRNDGLFCMAGRPWAAQPLRFLTIGGTFEARQHDDRQKRYF
jgi:hypothetical protein